MNIRDMTAGDYPAVLRLNEIWVRFLAPMDEADLYKIYSMSSAAWVAEDAGEVIGFLLALGPGQDYASPNYDYFAQTYEEFLYIDRIVIDGDAQGRGMGSKFYNALFAFAAERSVPVVTCEVDLDPPNETSLAFHQRLGFQEVSTLYIETAGKTVSLQARDPSAE